MPPIPPEGLTAADERWHRPGEHGGWGESWSFDFATGDGTLGGYVRLGLSPRRNACWYWASLVGEGRRLVTVIEHDVRPPRPPSLEIRAEALWADHNIEVPFDHVTLGCEAFALALDDPAEVFGSMRGQRVPFGLDLEWETDGTTYSYPPGQRSGATRYEVPCRVHGEVLVGDERIELDALGQRHHAWGSEDWDVDWTSASGWLDDGTRFHATAMPLAATGVAHGGDPVTYTAGYVQPSGDAPGTPPLASVAIRTTARADATGFPASAEVAVGDLRLDVTPVAFAPVLVEGARQAGGSRQAGAADGRQSQFVRALCRYRDPATGRSGAGWTEWNRPQP